VLCAIVYICVELYRIVCSCVQLCSVAMGTALRLTPTLHLLTSLLLHWFFRYWSRNCLGRVCLSLCLSVCLSVTDSTRCTIKQLLWPVSCMTQFLALPVLTQEHVNSNTQFTVVRTFCCFLYCCSLHWWHWACMRTSRVRIVWQ